MTQLYNTWSKWLSQAWNNQDLSKDHYDYRKYYNDQPIIAWLQLNSILAHNWNKHIPTGHFLDKGALAFSKLMDNYNRTNAQASYRAARNAKFSKEQARKYAEVGDPDSWVTAPFSWLIKKYYGVQAKHPIINAILP